MKIYIDTANLDEIKKAISLGIIDGVTTNPSLIAKESAKRLAKLGGTEKNLKNIPRRRIISK